MYVPGLITFLPFTFATYLLRFPLLHLGVACSMFYIDVKFRAADAQSTTS